MITFWKTAVLGLLVLTLNSFSKDEELITQKLHIPKGATAGETAGRIALSFQNTPYVARTLEQPGEEKLVINLHELDCTTFVENVLAFTRSVQTDSLTTEQFQKNLAHYRYYRGQVNGYGSRLHYFSSFLQQLQTYGEAKLMAEEWGGEAYHKPIHFMTQHRNLYVQLADEKAFKLVEKIENELNAVNNYYIPKNKIAVLESKMQTGDVIGITTAKAGLDVSHEGFAYRRNGRIHLLHASTEQKKVVVSSEPLADYLARHRDQTGIIVARLNY